MSAEWSGALTERVRLEHWVAAPEPGPDAAGGDAGQWRAAATLWASIVADGQGAPRDGEARRQRRRWLVGLRDPVTVTLQSRLVWRGTVLTVRAIDRDPTVPGRVRVRTEDRT